MYKLEVFDDLCVDIVKKIVPPVSGFFFKISPTHHNRENM